MSEVPLSVPVSEITDTQRISRRRFIFPTIPTLSEVQVAFGPVAGRTDVVLTRRNFFKLTGGTLLLAGLGRIASNATNDSGYTEEQYWSWIRQAATHDTNHGASLHILDRNETWESSVAVANELQEQVGEKHVSFFCGLQDMNSPGKKDAIRQAIRWIRSRGSIPMISLGIFPFSDGAHPFDQSHDVEVKTMILQWCQFLSEIQDEDGGEIAVRFLYEANTGQDIAYGRLHPGLSYHEHEERFKELFHFFASLCESTDFNLQKVERVWCVAGNMLNFKDYNPGRSAHSITADIYSQYANDPQNISYWWPGKVSITELLEPMTQVIDECIVASPHLKKYITEYGDFSMDPIRIRGMIAYLLAWSEEVIGFYVDKSSHYSVAQAFFGIMRNSFERNWNLTPEVLAVIVQVFADIESAREQQRVWGTWAMIA